MNTRISNKFVRLSYPDSIAKCPRWTDEVRTVQRGEIADPTKWNRDRITDLSVTLPRPPLEDMMWTLASECLIQDHLLEFFKSQGFSGFFTNPVKAKFKKSTSPAAPKIWELMVSGWGGMAGKGSGIEMIGDVSPIGGFTRYSGLIDPEKLIDEEQWDGSDFFKIWPMPMSIFVTRRVADAMIQAKFKGFRIDELVDLKRSQDYSPGVLSKWMPADIARERGEKSGITAIEE